MADNPRIEELRRRVQADPASIAFAALAEEFRRLGRYDEAVETCRTGLQRHPAYLSARVTLGRALIEIGDYDGAREELETVLRSAPENLAALRGLEQIHERLGQSTEMDPSLAEMMRDMKPARVVPPPTPEPPLPETAPESVTEHVAEAIGKPPTQPLVEVAAEPQVEAAAKPLVEVAAEPLVEAATKPPVEVTAEPVVEATAKPLVEVTAEPLVEAVAEPLAEIATAPVAEALVQPPSETVAAPIAEVPTEFVAETREEHVPEPLVETIPEPLVQAEPLSESVAPPVQEIAPMAPRHPEPSVFDSVPVLASVGAIDVEFPGEETEELFADDEPEPFVHRAESDLMPPDVPDPALAAALGRLEQFLVAIQHARHA